MKQANKDTQPESYGQPSAEFVEKSPSAKGSPVQTTVTETQSSETALSGLNRIRDAAKRDRNLRFTNLLHHVTEERLDPHPRAAKGVNDVTWQECSQPD